LFPHFLSQLAIVLFLQFPLHLQYYLLLWLIIQHTHVMAQHTVAAKRTYETSYRVLLLSNTNCFLQEIRQMFMQSFGYLDNQEINVRFRVNARVC
jgi:hypothetical protein